MAVGASQTLRDAALEAGRRAGLAEVGTCTARPFDATRSVLEERRSAGLHGGMAFTYRNPARSTDPSRALPGARSLVVGALRHGSGTSTAERARVSGAGSARVARYAAADHYGALRDALGAVAEVLRRDGWKAVVLADDNALVDRAAAHRAGIGWYGKSTNLLLRGRGSWFVLGAVLTDADLGGDPEPVADGCGTCERCITSCPTGAIVAPGVVDARRCLSWLLQATGPFPVEHREALGDRIYGCDDCQEVCPPNRRADRTDGADGPSSGVLAAAGPEASGGPTGVVAVDAPGQAVDVAWLLDAPDDELLGRVGRWYVPRRDPRYLRRNALVVLGNVADGSDPAVGAILERYLDCGDELLVEHAAWAARAVGRTDLVDARRMPRPVEVTGGPRTGDDGRP